MLLWDFFTRIMQGGTTAFLEDIWSRNFLNVFATPVLIFEYVTGLVATSVVTSALGLAVMLVLPLGPARGRLTAVDRHRRAAHNSPALPFDRHTLAAPWRGNRCF